MIIAHITPGTGGQFYCQNCFRDGVMLESLRKRGHEVHKVPMYLPLDLDHHTTAGDTPVFYGAINVYLKEKSALYRHAPGWMENIFNSGPMLHFAAKMSGSTEATGLEEMTLSMLRGEQGRQASELDQLIRYLRDKIKPDVVHLSNALLLGIAGRAKQDLGCKVICSLQDEHEWIDPMPEPYQEKIWSLMTQQAAYVDRFIAASQYYAGFSQRKMGLSKDRINVLYAGIDLNGYETSPLPMHPPVIGYLSRLWERLGLDILVDAFIRLKQKEFQDLRLHITGGHTAEDKPFIQRMKQTLKKNNVSRDVTFFDTFDKTDRVEFLKSLTLLSVPVPGGEALGTYQIEALASGVPIVQPDAGGFLEFVEATRGGVIFKPNTGAALAQAIGSLLNHPAKLKQHARQGQNAVRARFSIQKMVDVLIRIYEDVC